MLYNLRFFFSKCSLFHNANLFGSCIIHILYTGCTKIKKNNSGAEGLKLNCIDRSSNKILKCQISWKSVQWFNADRWTDRQTDRHDEDNRAGPPSVTCTKISELAA